MVDLDKIFEEIQKEEQEKWERKSPQEKLDYYKEQPLYYRYCLMSIGELEGEKGFNKYMADKLRHSIFKDPYYSIYGCEENIRRINTILKLKKEMK